MEATTALLEREGELAAIASALDAASAGEGGLLLIEGEAGAGKTALLGAAGQLGAAREMLVLSARGGEYERDFPYGVIGQLFEREVASGGGAPVLAGSAALAAPVFDPGAASPEGSDPFAVAHGLYWLAADLAAARPLLLLVDDAQWADRASLRALAYLARRLDGLPVALALTVRVGDPGEPADLLDELRQQPRAGLVEPPPLSAEAVAALVAAEIGGAPSGSFAARCFEASAGNPFLLTQLLRTLDSEDGASPDAERMTELAAAGAASSLLSSLARLGEHATAVARATAVLEPNAEVRLVAALAELPAEAVAAVSARMIGARLLTDSRPLSFVHPLVRAAVLGEVSGPLRAAAHRRAARLLHDDGAAVDAAAAHLLLAEPDGDEWAIAELRAAARAALGRGAPDAAIRYLRRALREPPATGERPAISRELGTALLAADDAEGIEVLLKVRDVLEDPVERAELVAEVALSLTMRRRAEEAIALLEESLAELPDPRGSFATTLRAYLLGQMFWGGERHPGEELLRPEGELDESAPGDRLCLHLLATLGALGLLPLARAQAIAERTITDRAMIEADSLAGWPPQGSLTALVLSDRRDLIAGQFEAIMAATHRRGAMPGIAGVHGNRAHCHYLDGDLREAQADAEIAVQIVSERGLPVPIFAWSGALLRCLTARGEYEAALALLAEPWAGGEVVPGFSGALFLCARGELLLAVGRATEAREDFLGAARRVAWLPLANPEALGWRPGLAACEAALGNGDEAWRLAVEAVERAREAGGVRGIGLTQRVLGEVSGGEEGIELLRAASTTLAGTNARLQHARALVSFGAALRRANRRRDAREPLREALDLAHRCGAVPLEELARTELAATGARPRRAVLSGVGSLTPSELRVARMAAEGMTNREIAQALTVTAKTVETHLRHVYQKLDVAGRAELGAALRQ